MSTQREQILSEACDLLVTGGLDGLSMRKLAARLGVTAPALYRHYESKEMVLVDVVGEAFKVFAQYLYRALEGRTASDRFSMTGRSYLAFALDHPQYYALLHVAHEIMGREGLPHEATDHACAVGQFMVDRVREGMESGMLKPGSPQTVARTIWAHSHGLVSFYHRGLLRTDEVGHFRRMDETEFRQLFLESSWRLMEGLAEPEFAAAMGERVRQTVVEEGKTTTVGGSDGVEGAESAVEAPSILS
ncbi:MAG: TetR/AcrR family transcriptional regulator [Gemmatimonadota bacterium]|nr:TetR/AcrR family transcriptional regulator [Gemmatimonadota bacterium]